jgi:hypothetical protein
LVGNDQAAPGTNFCGYLTQELHLHARTVGFQGVFDEYNSPGIILTFCAKLFRGLMVDERLAMQHIPSQAPLFEPGCHVS